MEASLSRRQFGLTSASLLGTLVAGRLAAEPRGPAYVAMATGESGKKTLPRGCVVPGTGPQLAKTGDDFEDEKWAYYPQSPKSSFNIDKNMRVPGGFSTNNLWVEAGKRGQPDLIKRVKTPPNGPPGSTGAMLFQTLSSGIPGTITRQVQQDDLLHNVMGQLGRTIPTAWTPNCVCRVYIPAEEYWERRLGPSFGFRAGLWGNTPKGTNEEYWPGIFLEQISQNIKGIKHEKIIIIVRGDGWGRDIPGMTFNPDSWCTLGMSFTPDGQCHFFARAGVEDLTADDHAGSYFSYSYRAHTFETFFFNVMNQDDGRSASTPWIVDNCTLHVASAPQRPQTAQQPSPPTVR